MNDIYDPRRYWENRGKNYRAQEYVEELEYALKLIRKYRVNKNSFLEVGSGYGRVYSYLKEHRTSLKNFTMCDISESMIAQCFKRTGIKPDLWDGKRLPYQDDSFDFVVLFSVLLHVPEKEIKNFVKECTRVARKYLLIATNYPKESKPLTGYCFVHDYYMLFSMNHLFISDVKCWKKRYRTVWFLKK